MDSKQNRILKKFLSFYNKNKKTPSLTDLKKMNITREDLRQSFNSLTELIAVAREIYPQKFYDENILSIVGKKEHSKHIRETIKNNKRFVITTAVTGCPVNDKFLYAIKSYCKKNKATLLVLACSDPAKKNNIETIDKQLTKYLLPHEIFLNDNLFISSIKMSAKQIDPSRSVSRVGHESGSVIYASPKQRLETSATAPGKYPLVTMGTGAITKPDYETDRYMSERLSYLADLDHVPGALIVEIEDDSYFHYRQIQAEKSGAFVDLNKKYTPYDKVEAVYKGALVLGDWHSGDTDPTAAKSWLELATLTKPKYIVLHDLFNGSSISHHETNNKILRAQKAEKNMLSLEEELKLVARDLEKLSKYAEKIVVVHSNHDEWIAKYIREARYIEDPQNTRVALRLGLCMLDGKNPLRYGVEEIAKCKATNIMWLSENQSFRFGGHELGCHGHKGSNGTRGSLKSLEKSIGACVVGHSHTPGILRKAKQVGTSTHLNLSYNSGPSSWLQTSCLIHSNCAYQLITSVEGKWRLE